MTKQYLDGFSSWADVSGSFGAGPYGERTVGMAEPEHVFAVYEDGGYDGSALVLYKDDAGFHSVEGSHCSCYGLEDQWKPHDETVETIRHQATQASSYGPWAKFGFQIAEWLASTGA